MAKSTPVYVGCKPCMACQRVRPIGEFSRIGMGLRKVCDACRSEPVPEPVLRTCTKCGETKSREEFCRLGEGYRNRCKECHRKLCRAPGSPGRKRFPTPPEGHRWCTKCDGCKPSEKFPRTKTGRGSWCNECVARHNREQYQKPEVRADRRARWARWKAENPSWDMEYYARDLERSREKVRRAANRRRARLNSLPVEPYTMAELVERDGPWCVLCDGELDFTVDHPHPDSATVEHLECISWPGSAGDIPLNCSVAHFDCNSKRGDRPHPAAARKRAELLAALT